MYRVFITQLLEQIGHALKLAQTNKIARVKLCAHTHHVHVPITCSNDSFISHSASVCTQKMFRE